MKTEADYNALVKELMAIDWNLTDVNVDHENVEGPRTAEDYWHRMYSAACMAAGMRAEEAGWDLNKLIGRVIY